MNQTINKYNNSRNTDVLWETIVRVTENMQDEIVKSLRIPIYLSLGNQSINKGRRNVRALASLLFRYTRAGSATIPDVKNGKIIASFPHATASNVNNLLPVAKLIHGRGLLGGIVVGQEYPEALNEFRNCVPIVSMSDLISSSVSMHTYHSIWRIINTFKILLDNMGQADNTYKKILKNDYGNILRDIIISTRASEAFKVLLNKWKPSCVISTSDIFPYEYQLSYQAEKLGIPTMIIQHGIPDPIWWPFVSTLYMMWGEPFQEELKDYGAPLNRITILGMPATDEIFRKYDARKVEQIDKGTPTCLILSSTHASAIEPEIYSDYIRYLKELIERTPYVEWKIKLHPSENDSLYHQLGNRIFRRLTIYPKSKSLEEAISEADVISTIYSTSGLEGMIMQKPLIIFDLSQRVRNYAWWPQYGGGIYAKTPDAFVTCIDKLVKNYDYYSNQIETQRVFLNKCFINRGKSAEAIADYLEDYCVYA